MASYDLVTLLSFFMLIYQGCKVASAFNPKRPLNAEGLFIFDAKSKEKYLNEEHGNDDLATERLLTDARLIINGVRDFFRTLMQFGLNIKVRIADIQILNKNIIPADQIGPNNVVDTVVLRTKFKAFLGTHNASHPNYDFAILMTGLALSHNANGIAFESTMCNGTLASGVVYSRGTWQDSHTIAHELGHIFGALHAPNTALTVMAPAVQYTRDVRKYAFSKLASVQIITYLGKSFSTRSCLLRTSPSSEVADLTPDKYVGNAQDPYYICQRSLGVRSVPCVKTRYYKGKESRGNNVCGLMSCRPLFDSPPCKLGACYVFTPTEGMQCDAGKSCRKGLCVDDPRPQLAVYKVLNYRTLKCTLSFSPLWAILKCGLQRNSDYFFWIAKDNDRAREIITASCNATACTSYSKVVQATIKADNYYLMISELTVIRREYFDQLEKKVWMCRMSAICGHKEKRVYFPK